jgi:pimeloyl-ACP methyl ester carboxylesterase
VLDDLGIDRFHVFGYSIGAQLCFHLAARAPERLRTFIAYGGHPYAPSPADVAFTEEINETLRQGMQAWVQRMETIGVLAQYPNPAARRARLLAADPLALLAVNAAYVEDLGVSDVLLGITMPCLLIAGERDGVNDLAHRAVRGVSTADFVSVGGIAHAMVHAKTILPYVFAFFERFGLLPPRGQAASQTRHPAVRQTATML